jgi:major tropism determinant Mtd-like protein
LATGLQLRRGVQSSLPTLLAGEPGFCTDTYNLFIGDGTNNHQINPNSSYVLYTNLSVPGGNTVANTTSETAFTSSGTIPANALAAGDVIRVTLAGVFGTAVLSPTLEGKLYIGSTVVIDTGALTIGAALSSQPWTATATLTVQSIGSSGNIFCTAAIQFATAATAALTSLVNSASNPFTINTTASQAITASAQWSAASASNTITLDQMVIEILKKR